MENQQTNKHRTVVIDFLLEDVRKPFLASIFQQQGIQFIHDATQCPISGPCQSSQPFLIHSK